MSIFRYYGLILLFYFERSNNMKITKELLIHWWHYYGKHIYTLEELEKFINLIDEKGAEKVFELATLSFICEDGSPTTILLNIRQNTIEHLFEIADLEPGTGLDEEKKKEFKEAYAKAQKSFYDIISSTYTSSEDEKDN